MHRVAVGAISRAEADFHVAAMRLQLRALQSRTPATSPGPYGDDDDDEDLTDLIGVGAPQ